MTQGKIVDGCGKGRLGGTYMDADARPRTKNDQMPQDGKEVGGMSNAMCSSRFSDNRGEGFG